MTVLFAKSSHSWLLLLMPSTYAIQWIAKGPFHMLCNTEIGPEVCNPDTYREDWCDAVTAAGDFDDLECVAPCAADDSTADIALHQAFLCRGCFGGANVDPLDAAFCMTQRDLYIHVNVQYSAESSVWSATEFPLATVEMDQWGVGRDAITIQFSELRDAASCQVALNDNVCQDCQFTSEVGGTCEIQVDCSNLSEQGFIGLDEPLDIDRCATGVSLLTPQHPLYGLTGDAKEHCWGE